MPSLLGLFELNLVGNCIFRVVTCVPLAIRLFFAYAKRSLFIFEQPDNLTLQIFLNASLMFGFIEMVACALMSIITIRYDFPGKPKKKKKKKKQDFFLAV